MDEHQFSDLSLLSWEYLRAICPSMDRDFMEDYFRSTRQEPREWAFVIGVRAIVEILSD